MISPSSQATPRREWSGSDNGLGYGRVWRVVDGKRRKVYVHREVFAAINGPIPEGKVVRHTCDNPRCVSPAHLILGTQLDNMRDMAERGHSRKGVHATHCKHGHGFTPDNTRYAKDGSQRCRECENAPRRKGGRLWAAKQGRAA